MLRSANDPQLPYVGVASVATWEQVQQVVRCWQKVRIPRLLLNIGFQTSDKMRERQSISGKWRPRMPDIDDLYGMIRPHPGCINIIHVNTDRPETHYRQLIQLINLTGGMYLDGFQLNMPKHAPWPDPKQLDVWPGVPGRRMILQIGPAALESVNWDANQLVSRLKEYRGVISDVMFDLSLGQGIGMDASLLLPYLLAVRQQIPDLGLTVAGGLGPGSMQPWKELRRAVPDLSCDAESRLRDSDNQLDLGKVGAYLKEVAEEVTANEVL